MMMTVRGLGREKREEIDDHAFAELSAHRKNRRSKRGTSSTNRITDAILTPSFYPSHNHESLFCSCHFCSTTGGKKTFPRQRANIYILHDHTIAAGNFFLRFCICSSFLSWPYFMRRRRGGGAFSDDLLSEKDGQFGLGGGMCVGHRMIGDARGSFWD